MSAADPEAVVQNGQTDRLTSSEVAIQLGGHAFPLPEIGQLPAPPSQLYDRRETWLLAEDRQRARRDWQ